jgi:septal ring-binding cell division protein DamX
MFSYSVKVYPLPAPMGSGAWKFVANADVIIDDSFLVSGFKVMQSDDGKVFASPPSEKDPKGRTDEKTGKPLYWPKVRYIDQKASDEDKQTPLETEMLDTIVAEFRKTNGRQTAPTATSTTTTTTTAKPPAVPATKRHPLWNGNKMSME